jgi:hypothetical protein
VRYYKWALIAVAFVVLLIADALADEQRRTIERWKTDD